MKREITKKYVKDDLTIIWQPAKCIHAAVCVKMLPEVYNPNEKPWIKQENASVAELKKQIDACPSGALSYTDGSESKSVDSSAVEASVMKNGPMLIKGDLKIKGVDGAIEIKSGMTAICRCGGSGNKPYCDGAHAKIGFEG